MERIFRVLGWIIFAAAVGWPVLALGLFAAGQGFEFDAGWGISPRQLGLLGRSAWMAAAATGLCLTLSLPVAVAWGEARQRGGLSVLLGATVLLTPPMIYAFGWGELFPRGLPGELRCILVWALWAWPIPAWIVGAGWARAGRQAYEAALLSTSPARAWGHAALPALRGHVGFSGLLLFVLFFSDYGVPHACGLIVQATELLTFASSSPRVMDTLGPAVPGLVLIGVLLGAAARMSRTIEGRTASGEMGEAASSRGIGWAACVLIGVAIVPCVVLGVRYGSARAMAETWKTYDGDIAWSVLTAAAGAGSSLVMGFALASSSRGRWAAGLTVLMGAMPGALVGVALVAAYNHAASAALYDGAGILVIAYVARFGWIGVLAGLLLVRGAGGDLPQQAMTDGANPMQSMARILAPLHAPAMAAAVGIITSLALAELPVSTLVRPPTFAPVAQLVIEKFHRFEYGMLFALCALLVVVAVGGASLVFVAWRRRSE